MQAESAPKKMLAASGVVAVPLFAAVALVAGLAWKRAPRADAHNSPLV